MYQWIIIIFFLKIEKETETEAEKERGNKISRIFNTKANQYISLHIPSQFFFPSTSINGYQLPRHLTS